MKKSEKLGLMIMLAAIAGMQFIILAAALRWGATN
jgi:hypothetical protein